MTPDQRLKRRGVAPGDEPFEQLRIREARDGPLHEQAFDLRQCCAARFDGRFSQSHPIVALLSKRLERRLGRQWFCEMSVQN
jgi:hypothetical protein